MPRETWTIGSVDVDAVAMYYTRTGGSKPQVLLLQGVTDDGGCWTRVAGNLEIQFDVIVMDARGHGRSMVGKVAIVPFPDEGFHGGGKP